MRAPRRLGSALFLAAILAASMPAQRTPAQTLDLGTAFEGYLELLRQQAGIPAISGVLVQDRVIVWERGLGYVNLESRIPARPDTPYLIGDLTESLASVLVLRCVEQRQLALDREITNYGGAVPEDRATIRQVLSHTSTGPGNFRFSPERYAQLTGAVEHCAGQPFRKTMALQVLDRLAMARSVPGRDFATTGAVASDMFEGSYFEHYRRVLDSLAVPYKVDKRGHATRTELLADGIDASTGLVSTAHDLAMFDIGLDSGLLLRDETRTIAWSPAAIQGGVAPTGLGWFVQNYRGTPVIWQYGVIANAYSGIMVKIPARRITMILLANSDGLAVPYQLEAGDVTRSPFAAVLLRMLL